MNYFLFKLRFKTALHLGSSDSALSLFTAEDHFRADTLFSALCHTAQGLYGPEGPELLIRQAERGELLLSDSMPWKEDRLYLPKPCFHAEQRQEIPAALRKAMKKLAWIPVSSFGAFAASVQGGEPYRPEENESSFGVSCERTHANVTDGMDTLPYQVGTFRFSENSGLWFLARCGTQEQEEQLFRLVTVLGMGGIGGKVSAGYGKFEVAKYCALCDTQDPQCRMLDQALREQDARHYLLLTSSLPAEEELEETMDGAYYQVVRRGGFVQSDAYAPNSLKKRTQYFLAAGAVTERRFHGRLYQVGGQGMHPVYRYSMPVMMGVPF